MKKMLVQGVATAVLYASISGLVLAEEIFTGDTRLACEAILCLSSSQRPGECSPSLERYFGIHHKKWSDTLDARRSFLNMCPTAHDVSANMPRLVEDIIHGAGRCDAAYLNQTLRMQRERQICTGWGEYRSCRTEIYYVIGNSLPSYCSAYWGNNYTYLEKASYVGAPEQGGQWVPEKDFVTEQARWTQSHPKNPDQYPWLD